MHQTKRQHLVTGYAVSLSVMTVVLSLLQPISPASAQDQTRSISQDIAGPGTQGRRIENGASGHRYANEARRKVSSTDSKATRCTARIG